MQVADAVLAIDLGGTLMRAAVVDVGGGVHDRRAQPTPREARCPDALLTLAGDVLDTGAAASAVIGVPGRVDYANKRLAYAPNLPPHWPEGLAAERLADMLGVDVEIANDADVAAVGEAFFGAGDGADDVAYVTVSTGVGAGVLLGRRLVRGRWSSVELGHTIVDHAAADAGRPSTLEALGSGTALGRTAEAAGLPPDGRQVVELVRDGDALATRAWNGVMSTLAAGITNIAHLFHPEVIVLGGGVGLNGDLVLAPLREALRRAGPVGMPEPIGVVAAALGGDAGLAGAAAWREATHGGAA